MRVPDLAVRGIVGPVGPGGVRAPIAAETWLDDLGGIHARCEVLPDGYRVDVPAVARFAFAAGGTTVTAERHPGAVEEAVHATYRRHVQPLVLHALGLEVLHASAVLTSRGVAAFCGPTGSGKSTLAVALSRRGHALWADDALGLDFGSGAPVALRLPFEPRLRPAARAVLGDASGPALPAGDAAPERAPLTLLALLEPMRAGGRTGVERMPGAAAFSALLPHAFCFAVSDAGRTRSMVTRYLAMAARVPVYRVPVEGRLDTLACLVARVGCVLEPPGGGA